MEQKTEQKKVSEAKRRIIENYEIQRREFQQKGFQESSEVFSVVKANVMVLVTSFPVMLILILLWIAADRGPIGLRGSSYLPLLILFLVTAYIHEVLHGVGWCLGTKEKWKSIYIGMMWSSLTPYCHCKEPLEPGKYLFGCLLPGTVLGLGIYILAFITGSSFLLWLSLLNVLGAGGDMLIAWYARRYRTGYVLDHPTECGFIIFQK
nr:DUF3267 domain-containing protein [uncultured Merdimonas sp.]